VAREITAVQFWDKLTKNLRAVNTAGWAPRLFDELVITADVFDVGSTTQFASSSLDLTGTQDTYVIALTVGKNNRIRLKGMSRAATTGSCYSFVLRKFGGSAVSIYGARQTGADHTYGLGMQVILEEGDSFGMAASGNVADSAVTLNYFYDLLAY